MKSWQKEFYTSLAWKKTREAYKQSVGGLCEICWSHGIIKAGELVHHKIPLTPQNYHDTNLSLDYSNLQCLCRDCHANVHRKRRFKLDDMGRVIF